MGILWSECETFWFIRTVNCVYSINMYMFFYIRVKKHFDSFASQNCRAYFQRPPCRFSFATWMLQGLTRSFWIARVPI